MGNTWGQFGRIRDYANQVLSTNPKSLAIVDVDPILGHDNAIVYKSIFIAFLQDLLKGCRPTLE